ncbi:Epoxide hydrolase N terminus [Rhizoctonia solani]|uniref:Epoxide hydrolase N terminus n=1 Tax=Rhizoctonia solani TaxID=456999 RepID=A0A8H7IJJ2_9AGAM|nr:Epoxide hydrolase N terminus [Rhizoctonia solani]
MTTSAVDILILGAGWLSHFLFPILYESNLTYAATSRTGLTPDTIKWSLGDTSKVLPKASTVVVMFPVENWDALSGSLRNIKAVTGTIDTDSDSVVTRHTPLPSNAPTRSLVEEQFLKAYPTTGAVLNLVGLHGRPPASGDNPHSSPRLVPNFLKRIGPSKNALKQKASVHFVHGYDAALAVVLVHKQTRGMVGRWIVSDCLVRDWWAIALEMGGYQEKKWVIELMKEEQVAILPRQKGLGRMLDGSDFWEATGSVPKHVGLTM